MYPQSMPTEWTHARTVRPWQSVRLDLWRVELNKFILELQYSAAFGRESKGDRKYAKFRYFLAHRVV